MSAASRLRRLGDDERFEWLRLIRSENVGPRTFRALLDNFGSPGAALDALPDLARRGGSSRPLRIASEEEITRELAVARKLPARFVAFVEPEYPPALRHIDSAPPIIAMRGREEALQQAAVAIVGSRNASAAGLTFAERIARALGEAGYVVASGLARGIDQRVHIATLATGAVGVLAGGLARPYPPEAIPLIERMIEFGAVLSEMPLEWEPRGRDFPRRNRIVSGLSLGTIVVEAARGSGSLITAKFAAEQNREVFAVPGSPLDPRAEGANDLLRQGAILCARTEDVIAVLDPLRDRDPFSAPPGVGGLAENSDETYSLWAEQPLLGVDPRETPRLAGGGEAIAAALPGDTGTRDPRARVLALLGPSPVSLDELARAAEAPAREIRAALIELELAGRVEFAGGDRVALRTFDESD